MKVVLNGEEKVIASKFIAGLLEELKLANKKVAVEQNKQIVPRTNYLEAPISEGDNIEIVHFIGGG